MVPSLQPPKYVRCQKRPLIATPRRIRIAEVKVGLGLLPYFADHGFQSMVVLPGSFCIDTALRLQRDFNNSGILQNIEFRRPVILSDAELPIKIDVWEMEAGLVEYLFSEATEESWFARLQITDPEPNRIEIAAFSIAEAQAGSFTEGKNFYDA